MTKARTIALILVAAAILSSNRGASSTPQPCRSMDFERNAYTVCEVDLRKQSVRLYWRRPDGVPYAYLSALPRTLDGPRGKLLFATNAGMFDPAFRPVGLYVERGHQFVHANTKSGFGNFHLKP